MATSAKSALLSTTAARDVNPLQNAEFCKALSVYVGSVDGPPIDDDTRPYHDALRAFGGELQVEQLDDRAQPVYYALSAMKAVLEELDTILVEHSDELDAAAKALLEKQSQTVRDDIERHLEHVSGTWRKFWLVVSGGAIGWQMSLVKGPDPSFIPLRIPVLTRSTAVFIDWILHPTASTRQLGDMLTQRMLTASPQQMLYTVAMVMALTGSTNIYEEEFYKPVNIALALSAVSVVIAATEWTAYRTRKTVATGATALVPNAAEAPGRADLRRRLKDNAGKMRVAQSWAKGIRALFDLSPGEKNAFGLFMDDIDEMVKTMERLAQLPASQVNPEFAEKLEPLYVCTLFAGIQIGAAAHNPISLGIALSWSEYALYRLLKYAITPARDAKQTWDLLDQVGGIVPAQFALHSIPLFIDKDAFEKQWLTMFSTVALTLLQNTVSHKTGPLVSAGSKPVIRGIKWTGKTTWREVPQLPHRFMQLLRLCAAVLRARAAEDQGEEMQPQSAAALAPLLIWMESDAEDEDTKDKCSLWQIVKDWEQAEYGEDEEYGEPLWVWLRAMEERDGDAGDHLPDPIWEWAEKGGSLAELLRAWQPVQPLFAEDEEYVWIDEMLGDWQAVWDWHVAKNDDLIAQIEEMFAAMTTED